MSVLQPIGRPKWPGDSDIGSRRWVLENKRSTLLSARLDDIRSYVQHVRDWIRDAEDARPSGEATFSWIVPGRGEQTYTTPRAELVWSAVLLVQRLRQEQKDPACSSSYAYQLLKECAHVYEDCVFDQMRRWPRRGRDGFDGTWLHKHVNEYRRILRESHDLVVLQKADGCMPDGVVSRLMHQNAKWSHEGSQLQRLYMWMCAMHHVIGSFVENNDLSVGIARAAEKHFGIAEDRVPEKWRREYMRLRENVRTMTTGHVARCPDVTRNQLLGLLPKPLDMLRTLERDEQRPAPTVAAVAETEADAGEAEAKELPRPSELSSEMRNRSQFVSLQQLADALPSVPMHAIVLTDAEIDIDMERPDRQRVPAI